MIELEKTEIEVTARNTGEAEAKEIYRNLKLLYGTRAGEQAMDRNFGIDMECVDYPMPSAQALITAELVRKTQQYEPRAKVERVEWVADEAEDGKIIPKVVIGIV